MKLLKTSGQQSQTAIVYVLFDKPNNPMEPIIIVDQLVQMNTYFSKVYLY